MLKEGEQQTDCKAAQSRQESETTRLKSMQLQRGSLDTAIQAGTSTSTTMRTNGALQIVVAMSTLALMDTIALSIKMDTLTGVHPTTKEIEATNTQESMKVHRNIKTQMPIVLAVRLRHKAVRLNLERGATI